MMSLPPAVQRLLGLLGLLLLTWLAASETRAAEPSVAGFAVGMDIAEVDRLLKQPAHNGVEIKRSLFGSDQGDSMPTGVAQAVSTIRIGTECSEPKGNEKCEYVTIYFARSDLGGRVRGVESIRYLSEATRTQALVDDLQKTYGAYRVSRSYDKEMIAYDKKVVRIQYTALGLLWGGASDRVEAPDAWFPINAREGQEIGGKYIYAELWQRPVGIARRLRLVAGDDDLNSRQADAWKAESAKRAEAARKRWQTCVDQFQQEQEARPATPTTGTVATERPVFGYRGIGQVRFTIPEDLEYTRAVPHFTAGSRLVGFDGCRDKFEVSVHSYREPQTPAKWRAEMEKNLRGRVPVKAFAGNEALLYVTQTDRSPNAEFRFVTHGALAAGRALILFEHFSNEESQFRRDRLLRLVASAEFLDAGNWPAWEQYAEDKDTWKTVEAALEKQEFREGYAGSRQICDRWTASRDDIEDRTLAGDACLQAAALVLTDAWKDGSPNPYKGGKGDLERALLIFGDAPEFRERRQITYANLAVVHGLGMGVPEDLALARNYYAKEEALQRSIEKRNEGKVGKNTRRLLEKLGY